MLIAADIGGTNARLALLDSSGRTIIRQRTFPSASFRRLEDVVRAFVQPAELKTVEAATFAVAGPVIDDRCRATNLPWVIDARALRRSLGITRLAVINDLVAVALGSLRAKARQLRILRGERPGRRRANVAVIAAGTGLGEAVFIWDGTRLVPSGTEGGHTSFAPQTELEFELQQFAAKTFGHVSWERIVSGPGIGLLYDFFRGPKRMRESMRVERELAEAPDRNARIAELGLAQKSRVCTRAVDLFVHLYGAETGNLALKSLAVGGVFVAGSIAQSLLTGERSARFLASFSAKGRFRALLEPVPIALVVDSSIGLFGSAYHAAASLK